LSLWGSLLGSRICAVQEMSSNLQLDEYLFEVLEAVQSLDGGKLAHLLSLDTDISKQIKVKSLQSYIDHRLEPPWNTIIRLHLEVLIESKLAIKSELQNQLAQFIHTILPQLSNWFTPIMIIINKDLYALSSKADMETNEKARLEIAARTMNKAFSICVTDRFSTLNESKKWAIYAMVALLFKTYFRLQSTNLCTTILKSLESADIPSLEQFMKSEQVTFKYYVGVLAFFNEKFESATSDLL
jgi:COP9 signalosome complex subunit 12